MVKPMEVDVPNRTTPVKFRLEEALGAQASDLVQSGEGECVKSQSNEQDKRKVRGMSLLDSSEDEAMDEGDGEKKSKKEEEKEQVQPNQAAQVQPLEREESNERRQEVRNVQRRARSCDLCVTFCPSNVNSHRTDECYFLSEFNSSTKHNQLREQGTAAGSIHEPSGARDCATSPTSVRLRHPSDQRQT